MVKTLFTTTTTTALLLTSFRAAFASPREFVTTTTTITEASPVDDTIHLHAHSHVARGTTGRLYCGNFANADGATVNDLSYKLSVGGLKNQVYEVAALGCNRVQCWDTSGIYVCNDNSHSLTVTGQQVHDVAHIINTHCCKYSQSGSENQEAIMSGQQFTQDGWNVVIGYANCGHSVSEKPSDTGGWGVNGGTCYHLSTEVTNS